MQMKEVILEKREGRELDRESLSSALQGYLSGKVDDYQMAAFLMAIFFRGMSSTETSWLTEMMWKSGETFPRKHRDDFWVDKHSTGGVGDKTSIILVPLVTAVCRRLFGEGKVALPMVSGRGLGHTGGTLDKLQAVPGFSPAISISTAMERLAENGFFMMGQTPELAPLDRKLYALRDATATVESLPLIVSSIMSKKLSENLDGLVLDVKVGSGAFMRNDAAARELSRALMAVGAAQKVKCIALVTSMDEPLGNTVGNALEIEECWKYLSGEVRESGLHEVTLALASAMVSLASRSRLGMDEARKACEAELEHPQALQFFEKMFCAQGGDWKKFLATREEARQKLLRWEWKAPHDGVICKLDAGDVGKLVCALGGGRNRKEDEVDAEVGMEFYKKVGAKVSRGEVMAMVYYREPQNDEKIKNVLESAVEIAKDSVSPRVWVREVLL